MMARKNKNNITNCQYAVRLVNISKSFLNGKIIANKDVNINVKYNEIHAICGENGAGKSTLMSILFGLYKQDSGNVFVNDKEVNFKNASQATKEKIGMVHQHFKLVKTFTILENIILGAEPTNKLGVIDRKKARQVIQKICEKYNFDLDLDMKTSNVSVGQQQRTEIIKLLYRDAKILIFDEPTAVLSDDEISNFLQMLKNLKQNGNTIILITHKLNEVREVSDTVTILRKGMTVGTYDINKITNEQISTLMVGSKVVEVINNESFADNNSAPLLIINNLTVFDKINKNIKHLDDISLNIKPGEIIGIAGIEGNGQSELALAIAGFEKNIKGNIYLTVSGTKIDITNQSIETRNRLGLSVVYEDRHKHGCVLDETVAFNLVSNQINTKFSLFNIVNKKRITNYAEELCSRFNIAGSNKGKSIMRSLSGGNQQKVVIAREFSKYHNVLLLVQPTRGLDIGAINFIHQLVIDEAKKGKAIILISYELDEILKLADTIYVMDRGKFIYSGKRETVDKKTIGKLLSRATIKNNAIGGNV